MHDTLHIPPALASHCTQHTCNGGSCQHALCLRHEASEAWKAGAWAAHGQAQRSRIGRTAGSPPVGLHHGQAQGRGPGDSGLFLGHQARAVGQPGHDAARAREHLAQAVQRHLRKAGHKAV